MSILTSLLNKLIPYKLYLYGAVVLAFVSLLGYNWYLRVEVKSLKTDYKLCNEANKTNNETILSLRKEIKNSNSLCEERLKSKENIIKKLKEIDKLDSKHLNKNDKNLILKKLNEMYK